MSCKGRGIHQSRCYTLALPSSVHLFSRCKRLPPEEVLCFDNLSDYKIVAVKNFFVFVLSRLDEIDSNKSRYSQENLLPLSNNLIFMPEKIQNLCTPLW